MAPTSGLSNGDHKRLKRVPMKLKSECLEVKAKQNYQKDYRKFPGQTVREEFFCRKVLKHPKRSPEKVVVKKNPEFTRKCKMECCLAAYGRLTCRRVTMPSGMACARGKTCKRNVCGVHTWEQFK
ncbi:uncharacterized protein LOC142564406 [Dermacentor variabilis]|uniref:uncharacterized protein LOC142564406 n=1 Tax=Dermacentor variabilis TaxID=34621 RepID=UPI003F5AE685